ncbi:MULTISPECIES: MFS transporter [unclassified Microbacterium]|uniref:MFS transporter n=1 Tax=unclassified Microbacterium TaxID=2609290 RepID=UPI000CFD3D5B|nr:MULTISPECIES: MFS transporter [unclassified Microbacterium]PQZ54527.1 MFS transporter [Microbacterium sp. MYb43]PQZ71352.1 MFS transporter [Microbacterium sp. MYb40]PRB19644.1 MFS transporter [Microbacterium sp. MYb54]PRB25241.1 MFS transporter [Microbacterium sp. MYb50]PRB57904.1 MFS transporter [Microbacterium sp. MYb24]
MHTQTITASPGAVAREPVRGGRAVGLVATLILGVLSFQLNASMITPALPDIAAQLGEDIGQVSQVSSLFFVAGAVGGVVLGRWSDFIGRKRALFVVLGILSVGTLLCLFAPNLTVLLIGRVLQGASSAAFQLAYVILSESLSAKVFGTTLGIITAVNGGVGGIDGYIGGLLSQTFGFRSIFVVIFIVGLIAIVCVALVIPNSTTGASTGKMDWWGAAVLSIALISVTYFVSSGPSAGWLAPITLLYLAGTIGALVAFWFVEKRRTTPLIAVEHLRSRQVWPVVATTVLTLASVFAVINFTVVLLSQDTANGFGLDPATSALLFLAPPALIGVFAAPMSGWLAGRKGWIPILRIGMIACLALLIVIAMMPQSFWVVFAMIALLGVTYNGIVLTTINGLGVVQSPAEAPAALPGLNGSAFGIGAGLGIGIVAPFAAQGTTGGYVTALWISVGITALALITSFLIKPRISTES